MICSQICQVSGLELLPGDIELYDEYLVSKMLHEDASRDGSETDFNAAWNQFEDNLLRHILEPVLADYDFILLDCAPGYNLLTRSGLAASDFYILPARPEPLSLVGIQLLEQRIAKLKKTRADGQVRLQLAGIAFILSGGSFLGKYYKQVMQRVERDFVPEQIFKTRVPMDVNIAKAVDLFTPAVLATPNSAGSKAFFGLTEELLARATASGTGRRPG